jgi:lipoprotein-anchoring transpeptidase ErfK/SrfK
MILISLKYPFYALLWVTFCVFLYSQYASSLETETESTPHVANETAAALFPELEFSSSFSRPRIDMSPFEKTMRLPKSLYVRRDHTVVRLAPTRRAKRRGVVMKDARLPVLRSLEGPGCKTTWYQVHTDGWICGDFVVPGDLPPWGAQYPIMTSGEITPWPYAFVYKPTIEYRMNRGVLEEMRDLLAGFGFGVQRRIQHAEQNFFLTAEGTLVPRNAAGVSRRVSTLSGIALDNGKIWPVGFVHSKQAWAYSEPKRNSQSRIGKVERYAPFRVLEKTGTGRGRFFRFDKQAWLSARDVRVAANAPLPKDLAIDEKWIDVDTRQQIIVAYEGKTPVYATLISTGRTGHSHTIKGTFRIWAKVAAIAMDNTDEELEETEMVDGGLLEERNLFSLHDVPWTQFFFENYALHGVYWHNGFGNRRSHGCVNMAPIDARWFFNWTEPRLPNGWWALHKSPNDKGTLVRVR